MDISAEPARGPLPYHAPMPPSTEPAPDQFYTGLVAELYDPLVGERATAERYAPLLDRHGTPALELACGSGRPLLDLVAAGYDIDGLDASEDMLTRCRAEAAARGLRIAVHRGLMQSFTLPRRYRCIFLAGASFTLLTRDADALAALACMYRHLQPGGTLSIPLERIDPAAVQASLGRFREAEGAGAERLRCGVVACTTGGDGRDTIRRLRYERLRPGRPAEVLERDWCTRTWPQAVFAGMLTECGFSALRMRAPGGGPAAPQAGSFVAVAERPASAT